MKRPLAEMDRAVLFRVVIDAVAEGDMSIGDAVRALRAGFLGLNRTRFAAMVGISPRSLADLETSGSDPRLGTLQRVFAPFGIEVGLLPRSDTATVLVELSDADRARHLQAVKAAVRNNERDPT